MSQSTEEPSLYTEQYVAFVDVLGFSELIQQSATRPDIGRDFIWMSQQLNDPEYRQGHFQATSFSDSIVVSIPIDETVFPMLLKWLALTSLSMLNMGFPLRGALARARLPSRRGRAWACRG